MADTMFPGANSLGETASELFNPQQGAADAYYQQITKINRESRINSVQNQGVNNDVNRSAKANVSGENSPQYGNEKNRPTATEDPQDVEERWMARMAKFAGIASGTGAKI